MIATSGTCDATIKLVELLGGKVMECAFLVELPDLHGKKKLENMGYKVFSIVQFGGH